MECLTIIYILPLIEMMMVSRVTMTKLPSTIFGRIRVGSSRMHKTVDHTVVEQTARAERSVVLLQDVSVVDQPDDLVGTEFCAEMTPEER